MSENKNFLSIPLPDNTKTGWSCGEVAAIATLKYLNAQPALDEDGARELTHKIPAYNTWPEQLLRIAFAYPEIHAIIYRTKTFNVPIAEHICQSYSGVAAQHLLEETDENDLEKALQECEKRKSYSIQNITLETILAQVRPGRVVIPWACFDALYRENISNGFNAHYVIITGYDLQYVYVHECGGINKLPEANKLIERERFMKALGPDPNFMVWSINKKFNQKFL